MSKDQQKSAQPAASACVGCEGKPAPENNPCAVCGQPAASAEPVTGGLVSELLSAIRNYGGAKWVEGHGDASDDRSEVRSAWDEVYRLVQALAAPVTAHDNHKKG